MILSKTSNNNWVPTASGNGTFIGTLAAFNAIKDTLPVNTVAYITDDSEEITYTDKSSGSVVCYVTQIGRIVTIDIGCPATYTAGQTIVSGLPRPIMGIDFVASGNNASFQPMTTLLRVDGNGILKQTGHFNMNTNQSAYYATVTYMTND